MVILKREIFGKKFFELEKNLVDSSLFKNIYKIKIKIFSLIFFANFSHLFLIFFNMLDSFLRNYFII